MTAQKIYAVLRKAGHQAAKWQSSSMVRGWGEYSNGVRVIKDSDTYKVWFKVSYNVRRSGTHTEQSRNVMANYIIPALNAAGITGALSEDGLTYRIEE